MLAPINRRTAAGRIRCDWYGAAKRGLTLGAAARELGRPMDEGRACAAAVGFRFSGSTRANMLPSMTAEERRFYVKLRNSGFARDDALAAAGVPLSIPQSFPSPRKRGRA